MDYRTPNNLPSKHPSWWRRFQKVFIKTNIFPLPYFFRRRFQNVLIKTNISVLVIPLQNIFKRFSRYLAMTSSRRFQDVFKTHCRNFFKTFSRRIEHVFKTFYQVILQRCLQDISTTHPFKTYRQVKMFLLTRSWDHSK